MNETTEKRRQGRPPKAPGDRHQSHDVRLHPNEWEHVKARAGETEVSAAAYIRQLVRRDMRRKAQS